MAWVDAPLQSGAVESVWQCMLCAKEPPRPPVEPPTNYEMIGHRYTEMTINRHHIEGHHIAKQRPTLDKVLVECDWPPCDVLKELSPYRVGERNYCCMDHHHKHRRQRGWHPKRMAMEYKP